ncbi:hypothetical protein Cob_v009701 [Colletotrichum orbiculare MAFF 240422]|uniref:Uncharacterized protein n=1 Tax=Colletotrichum orbiculare (strain 104-T / ATCC 96160 / CBS 514.97 / LARS 414 / MAFF 240422) TaxID=1213857 RepID=A0A484FG72_COLOR|nr:hypothetical protein Cob_v009701 [Colletotrichum orbiculare MAFF 240422]
MPTVPSMLNHGCHTIYRGTTRAVEQPLFRGNYLLETGIPELILPFGSFFYQAYPFSTLPLLFYLLSPADPANSPQVLSA